MRIKLFENFDSDETDEARAKRLGIIISDGEFDGEPIKIWTVEDAKGETFHNIGRAIDWLVKLLRSNDDVFDLFNIGLSTKDNVIVGDYELGGSDVQDQLRWIKKNK